jgi:energy-coupling factor transporter ATP-binding protein EcfA2
VTPALLFTLNSRVCRVTIAQQLVTEPAVLVLDEPTSGLDSYTALHLMRTLKQVASSGGRIVLLSFHQPSPAMFSLLDRAYLMAQVGAASWLAGQRGAAEGQAVRAARAAG